MKKTNWEKEFDKKFQDPMTKKYGKGIKLYCSFCSGEWRKEIKEFIKELIEPLEEELERAKDAIDNRG